MTLHVRGEQHLAQSLGAFVALLLWLWAAPAQAQNCGYVPPSPLQDTVFGDCEQGYAICLDLPLDLIGQHVVTVDGAPYQAGFAGCNQDTVFAYTFTALLGAGYLGPYVLNSWTVDGTTFSGQFFNILALADSMNVWDPTGNWQINPAASLIFGGNDQQTYSNMAINQLAIPGSVAQIGYNEGTYSQGTQITVDTGQHTIIIQNLLDNCADTLLVDISCIDCSATAAFFPEAADTLVLSNCAFPGTFCLDASQSEVAEYSFFVDGAPYAGSFVQCAFDTVIAYTYFTLFGQGLAGPYTLNSWTVNGNTFSGPFDNIDVLVDSMNIWDPTGNWVHQPTLNLIVGGNPNNTYSVMQVTENAIGSTAELGYNEGLFGLSLGLSLPLGQHEVLAVNNISGCADTVQVLVRCATTPDTLFESLLLGETANACLDQNELLGDLASVDNICPGQQDDFAIALDAATGCFDYTAQSLGTDTLCLVFCDGQGICDSAYYILTAIAPIVLDTLIADTLPLGSQGQWCAVPPFAPASFEGTCAPSGASVAFVPDGQNACVGYTGLAPGTDTFCLQICNGVDACANYTLVVTVLPDPIAPSTEIVDIPLDSPAQVFCVDPSELQGPVANLSDICSGDADGIVDVAFVGNGCVSYAPLQVGTDSICLVFCDALGNCDTTTLIVNVLPPAYDLEDELRDTVLLGGEAGEYCVDLSGVPANLASAMNVCAGNGAVAFALSDEALACVSYAPQALGVDTACFELCFDNGFCDTVLFIVTVLDEEQPPVPADSTVYDTVFIGAAPTTACLPLSFFPLPIESVSDLCAANSGPAVDFVLENSAEAICLSYAPAALGSDSACIQVCMAGGLCYTLTYVVTVLPLPDVPQIVVDTIELGGPPVQLCYLEEDAPIVSVQNLCTGASGSAVAFDIVPGSVFCLNYAPLDLGTDTACVEICLGNGTCDTITYFVTVVPPQGPDLPETLFDTIQLSGFGGSYCPDLGGLPSPVASITNACPAAGGTAVAFDLTDTCADYQPLALGTDSACVVLCLENGLCDTVTLIVTVIEPQAPDLPGIAFDTISLPAEIGSYCIDTTGFGAPVASIANVCEAAAGSFVDFGLIEGGPYCADYAPIAVGTDTACLVVCLSNGLCDTLTLLVTVLPAPEFDLPALIRDTIFENDPTQTYCFGADTFPSIVISASNACAGLGGTEVGFVVSNDGEVCLQYTPFALGTDTACVAICLFDGTCDTVTYIVTVLPEPLLLPLANDDAASTFIDVPLTIAVLENDQPNGNITDLDLVSFAQNGIASVGEAGQIQYVPSPGFCGLDSFSYEICNANACDTAQVLVSIDCEGAEPTVYNGFSPNGDGQNDVFTIENAEAFPDNVLLIFNRWGNKVYESRGYLNTWDGTWDGQPLPDGVYFYHFEKGNGEAAMTGWIALLR